MSATVCMAPERIAQLVTEGLDETARSHVFACASCRALLDDQLEVRKALDRVPAPALTRSRREAMAAEIMARADLDDAPRPSRRGRWAMAVALVSVAATSVLVLRRTPVATDAPSVDGPMHHDALAIRTSGGVGEASPAPGLDAPIAPARLAGLADYARQAQGERDIVQLRGGELTVDATDARPVQIVTGGTVIAVRKARVKVVATGGAIAQVSVFAGTAEVTVDGRRVIVEAGEVWERPAEASAPEAETGAAAFRAGWTALRAGKHADAIAAFDRATDPAVAEDALYWSAVACERAGDLDDARRRYQAVIERFGASPRVVEAKAALARLSAAPAP